MRNPTWKNNLDGVTLTFNGPKTLSVKKGGNNLDGVNDGLIDGARSEIIRYLKLAKLLGVIEFRGASKTGGYFLTKKMKEKLKQ